MEVGQRRRDVRAGQIRTHQHDRPLRKQPRHLRGLREGLVPQRQADHGETRARDEPHEERAGGQGQPRPIPGGGHARQQADGGQGSEEHREREDDRDVPPHRFHLQARLQRVVQIQQADDAEEQAHNGQPRCGVGAPGRGPAREPSAARPSTGQETYQLSQTIVSSSRPAVVVT